MKSNKMVNVLCALSFFSYNLSSYAMDAKILAEAEDYFSRSANEIKLHITAYVLLDPTLNPVQKRQCIHALLQTNRTIRDFIKSSFIIKSFIPIHSTLSLFALKQEPRVKFLLGSSKGKVYHDFITQISTIAQYIFLYHQQITSNKKFKFPSPELCMQAIDRLNHPSCAYLKQIRNTFHEQINKDRRTHRKLQTAFTTVLLDNNSCTEYAKSRVLYLAHHTPKIVNTLLRNSLQTEQEDSVVATFKEEDFDKRFRNEAFWSLLSEQTSKFLENKINGKKRRAFGKKPKKHHQR